MSSETAGHPLKKFRGLRAYPPWVIDPNVPIPESVIEASKPKIEQWMREPREEGAPRGIESPPPALPLPPLLVLPRAPKLKVMFKVLNLSDKPIFGFRIWSNGEERVTDSNGEVHLSVYQGHNLDWATARESGWSFPNGAKRKARMVGMVPIAQTLPINAPTTIFVYPQSGEFTVNGGRSIQQAVHYL